MKNKYKKMLDKLNAFVYNPKYRFIVITDGVYPKMDKTEEGNEEDTILILYKV